MLDTLMDCREAFGPVPRQFGLFDRMGYMRLNRPGWVRGDDFEVLFRGGQKVFSKGVVVWGAITQANNMLFGPGKDDCPGEVVFSLDDPGLVDLYELEDVAHGIYQLKGTEPEDRGLAHLAYHLTDELTRVFGLRVPDILSPGFMCHVSSTFFLRKHLPERRLCRGVLPIVVDPREPHLALPLPERYWPENLSSWWSAGEHSD